MFYPDDLLDEIRSRNDIVDVISGYVKLQKKGSSYFGLCPFHSEKSPSFSVSPSKQMYYCFGCGAGGNVFTFLQQYENYTFQESVKVLADRAGIALPEEDTSEEAKKQKSLRQQILDVNRLAAKFYYYMLRTEQGKGALQYLTQRELSEETIRHFGLGFSGKYSNALSAYMKKQGVSDSLLREAGLVQYSEKSGMYDKFWNRVMFPIMDVNNRVIGFGGRVMGDAKPKYLNSPETIVFDKSRNLYGLNFARTSRQKQLLVCEGYMDVISMHQAGFTNSVASLGTALTSQHASLLKRYTDEVVLTYDSDEAGTRAALRAIPMMKAAGILPKVLSLAPYKDPDEFIKARGQDAFRERIENAENSFLFEIRVLQRSYDMSDPDSKTAFFRETAGKIAEYEQEIERENYIEAVAQTYHTSFEGLRKMVGSYLMQGVRERKPVVPAGKRPQAGESFRTLQKRLLSWIAEYPQLGPVILEYFPADAFEEGLLREVAKLVEAQLKEGKLEPAAIVDHFEEMQEQQEAAAIFHSEVRLTRPEDVSKAVKENLRTAVEILLRMETRETDASDIGSIQKMIADKKKLQQIDRLQLQLT